MKKYIYFLAVLAFAFSLTSCSKKDGSGDLPHPEDHSMDIQVPSSFGKKMLIEELTATWCGACPVGNYTVEQIDAQYPGKAIAVAIHVSDIMEVPQLLSSGVNLLDNMFQVSGTASYPNGAINRGVVDHPVTWPAVIPGEVGLFPKCGFAIDASSVSGNTLSLTVHTGFSANLYSDYRLNVWITEADVHSTDPNYDQQNFYSATGSSPDSSLPYYNMPPTINDFHHDNVLRKLVTSVPYGDRIPQDQMVKGNDYIRTFSVNLAGLNWSKCYVVAFVDKYGTAMPQHQVQNAQKVKIGSSIGWN